MHCVCPIQDPHMFSFFPSSDCSQLPSQSSGLSHPHCLRTALCWKKRRVHHLLRPGGGHGHLHLRTHVSVQRLWPEAKETDQCVLSDMQEADQRRYQNVPAVMARMLKSRCCDFHSWMPPGSASQARLDTDLGPNRRLATPGHNCAYISFLYG